MNSTSRTVSVVQINDALRRRECAYYLNEGEILPIIKSQRHQGVFQVRKEDGQWIAADHRQVLILKPIKSCVLGTQETSPRSRTTKHNIEMAFHLMRRLSCRAVDGIEGRWEEAFKKAAHWSGIDQPEASILYTQEIGQVSFREDGELIFPLLCAWKGNLERLQACLQANDLVVTVGEQPFTETWSRLVIERNHA